MILLNNTSINFIIILDFRILYFIFVFFINFNQLILFPNPIYYTVFNSPASENPTLQNEIILSINIIVKNTKIKIP